MNSIFKKLNPSSVFTPRGEFNKSMYVHRTKIENCFKQALMTNMNILVQGNSGIGKTWLTRSVLEENGYYYKCVNLAQASNCNSIYTCFKTIMCKENWQIRSKYTELKKANVKIPVADGGISHTSEYTNEVDYYLEFLKFMQHRAKDKKQNRYIIFENFEQILENPKLIKELTNLITLVDDDEVAKFKTKFIIIGATNDILKYFSNVTNVNTIDNRLYELPTISFLTYNQTSDLVLRGFKALRINFLDETTKNEYLKFIAWVTNGIPQRIHEFCLILTSKCIDNSYLATESLLQDAKEDWIITSLSKNYSSLLKLMNHSGRGIKRNQILYCLGLKETTNFTAKDILSDLKDEFPTSNKKTKNISSYLNNFCNCNPPLLSFNKDTKEYSFNDIKNVLCIRSTLYKNKTSEQVEYHKFDDIA